MHACVGYAVRGAACSSCTEHSRLYPSILPDIFEGMRWPGAVASLPYFLFVWDLFIYFGNIGKVSSVSVRTWSTCTCFSSCAPRSGDRAIQPHTLRVRVRVPVELGPLIRNNSLENTKSKTHSQSHTTHTYLTRAASSALYDIRFI